MIPQPADMPQASRHLKTWILVAALSLLVQLALLALAFPLPGWEEGQGLFHIDHPFHIYQVTLGRALLEHGSLVGYDPFFGGGNIGGVTFNASAKLPVLISWLIPNAVSTEFLYTCYVFLCALIAPCSLAGVGVLLRWSVIQTTAVVLLGTLFWWVGSFHWYHTAGMVSFVCASYTSIAYSVWIYRIIGARNNRWPYAKIGMAGIIGGLGMWLHPFFGIMAGVMVATFMWAHSSELSLRSILARGTPVGLIAFALNVPWILAMRADSNILGQPYQKEAGVEILIDAVLGIWGRSMGSILNPLVIILGLAALYLVLPERRRALTAFLGAGTALILFAAFGAKVNLLSDLQPNRFFAPGFLIIGIGASYAVEGAKSWLQARQSLLFNLVVAFAIILAGAVLTRELVREVTPGPHGHYGKSPPEVTNPSSSVAWLVSWINENTSSEGRILFETSLARKHGGGHIAGYLALQTKREFIGAPYPFTMPERSFWDGTGFGQDLAGLTTEHLVAGLNLYNVGWVIAHSAELTRRMEELPQARVLAQQGDIRIFGINRPLTYFHAGDAKVTARDFDRLEVAAKPGAPLILRYHWVKGITTTPATQIDPISLSPNFPPFIQISNAPEHFTIHINR